jgi:hypothetical protein
MEQKGLPDEPKRKDFPDEESFLEARDSWRHNVLRIKRLAQSTIARRSKGSPSKLPSQATAGTNTGRGGPMKYGNASRSLARSRKRTCLRS